MFKISKSGLWISFLQKQTKQKNNNQPFKFIIFSSLNNVKCEEQWRQWYQLFFLIPPSLPFFVCCTHLFFFFSCFSPTTCSSLLMVEGCYSGLLMVHFIFLLQSISNTKNHSEVFSAVQILVRNACGGGNTIAGLTWTEHIINIYVLNNSWLCTFSMNLFLFNSLKMSSLQMQNGWNFN